MQCIFTRKDRSQKVISDKVKITNISPNTFDQYCTHFFHVR